MKFKVLKEFLFSDKCGPGFELQANGIACLECPKGKVKLPGDTVCTDCPDFFTTDVNVAAGDRVCVRKCIKGTLFYFSFRQFQQF